MIVSIDQGDGASAVIHIVLDSEDGADESDSWIVERGERAELYFWAPSSKHLLFIEGPREALAAIARLTTSIPPARAKQRASLERSTT